MESRSSGCKCPDIEGSLIWGMWESLPPSHPSAFPWRCQHPPLGLLGFSLSVVLIQQPNTSNSQNLETNNNCSRLVFRTRPQIHLCSKSPHQNIQSRRKILALSSGGACEHPGWELPSAQREPQKVVEWFTQHLGWDHKEMECPSLQFGMRSIKKQNDLESILQIQCVWNVHLKHFCDYGSFSLRIAAQSTSP